MLQINECAPVYFVVGDAGNEEGPETITTASETVRQLSNQRVAKARLAGYSACGCSRVQSPPAAVGSMF